MLFDSLVFYAMINTIFLIIVKKTAKKVPSKIFWIMILGLYFTVLIYDLKKTLEKPNIFKFFHINKNFTQIELSKNKRELMARYHPDKNSELENYLKT